jgi:galactonate dehydratase
MTPDRVLSVSFTIAAVTPNTKWSFIEIKTQSGLRGVGEASLVSADGPLSHSASAMARRALELPHAAPAQWSDGRPLDTMVDAAVFSAIDQALWDIEARRQGVIVAALLADGQPARTQVPLYANINRRTDDRSPAGFADSARRAVSAGFDAVKIAPFDDVTPNLNTRHDLSAAIDKGLARCAAVREVVGAERQLMIDCHWRFDEAGADALIAQAAQLGVYWIECPIPETPDRLPAIARLRAAANSHGLLLAGCEERTRVEGFAPFLKAGAYDVMMPDAKYAGGLTEMLRLAALFETHGVTFSPHNPSGPVCHAASLQVCAAVPACGRLEMQFDETPVFTALQAERLATENEGVAVVGAGIGLAVTLDPDQLAAHATTAWVAH